MVPENGATGSARLSFGSDVVGVSRAAPDLAGCGRRAWGSGNVTGRLSPVVGSRRLHGLATT
jgi:hypothetical protein